MKASIERTGGFAGMRMTTTVDSDALGPDDARRFQQLVTSCQFFSLPNTIAASKPMPDRFSYTVTIEDNGRSHTVTVGETSVSGNVKSLLDFLTTKARR
ncbi:MAG TPA: protealysin inhibitor emfourin [Anaerolineae bacterium]